MALAKRTPRDWAPSWVRADRQPAPSARGTCAAASAASAAGFAVVKEVLPVRRGCVDQARGGSLAGQHAGSFLVRVPGGKREGAKRAQLPRSRGELKRDIVSRTSAQGSARQSNPRCRCQRSRCMCAVAGGNYGNSAPHGCKVHVREALVRCNAEIRAGVVGFVLRVRVLAFGLQLGLRGCVSKRQRQRQYMHSSNVARVF